MPRTISKFGRPLPYFMKYNSEYYSKQKLSASRSNMNLLCWKLERWEKGFRWKRTFSDFDYNIMLDKTIDINPETYQKIEEVFLRFCTEMVKLSKEQVEIRKKNKDFMQNWAYIYDLYKRECLAICSNKKVLANIAVTLYYEKYPKKNNKFMWCVASEGILENIEQQNVGLPNRCENGEHEYLGKKYILIKTRKDALTID